MARSLARQMAGEGSLPRLQSKAESRKTVTTRRARAVGRKKRKKRGLFGRVAGAVGGAVKKAHKATVGAARIGHRATKRAARAGRRATRGAVRRINRRGGRVAKGAIGAMLGGRYVKKRK